MRGAPELCERGSGALQAGLRSFLRGAPELLRAGLRSFERGSGAFWMDRNDHNYHTGFLISSLSEAVI